MSTGADTTREQAGRSRGGLMHGLRIMGQVLRALTVKDFVVRMRVSRMGMLWILLEPAVGILVLSSIWFIAGRHALSGVPLVLFIASGYLPFQLLRTAMTQMAGAVKSNQALYDYPNVRPADAIIARLYLDSSLIYVAGLAIFLVLYLADIYAGQVHDAFALLLSLALLQLLALAAAFFFGVLAHLQPAVEKTAEVLGRLMLFISGVFYDPSIIPEQHLKLLAYNPLLHIIAEVRYGLFGLAPPPVVNLHYPLWFAIGMLFIGLAAYENNKYRIMRS